MTGGRGRCRDSIIKDFICPIRSGLELIFAELGSLSEVSVQILPTMANVSAARQIKVFESFSTVLICDTYLNGVAAANEYSSS